MSLRDQRILAEIRALGGATSDTVAEKVGLSAKHTARILNELAASGHVYRSKRPQSRGLIFWQADGCQDAMPAREADRADAPPRVRSSAIDPEILGKRVLEILAGGEAKANEIAPLIGVLPRELAPTLTWMERRGEIEKAGVVKSAGGWGVTIWCIARPHEAALPPAPPPRPEFTGHASLTAAFFGDPPIGRSALDQRRMGA